MSFQSFVDFIWPKLNKISEDQKKKIEVSLRSHITDISSVDWSLCSDVALEEARRLNDDEANRRRSAESKAIVLLASVGAILPVLATVGGLFSVSGYGSYITAFFVTLFFATILHVMAAAVNAFKVIKVSVSYRVDVPDLVSAWEVHDPKKALIRKILVSVRNNWDAVNEKVSYNKLAQAHFVRAMWLFFILMVCRTAIYVYQDLDFLNTFFLWIDNLLSMH